MPSWYTMNRAEDSPTAEIYIYDEIGFFGISAKRFLQDLKSLGDVETINLFINSPGGEVFDGAAIINALSRHKAKIVITIDGLAASMASGIAMVGDTVVMADNAMMMIHNPWNFAAGDADEMRKNADFLDKLKETLITNYNKKTGISREEIARMMDEETWMDAEEAVELGFADEIAEGRRAAASTSFRMLSEFRNVPKAFLPAGQSPAGSTKTTQMKEIAKALGLSEDAKQEQITAAIAKLQASAGDLADVQDQLKKVTAERDQLRTAADASQRAAAEATVQAAIDAGKIKADAKDSFIKLYVADAESAKAALGALEAPKSAQRGHAPLPAGNNQPDGTPSLEERIKNAKDGRERIQLIREYKAQRS